ncbi:MAG: DEAD/DEAH box helicase [Chitinophagaceae bacterium]
MAYFKNLITDKILKNKNAIKAQRLASCMAWQILNDYPRRQKPEEWKIYNNLRGVMLADEVGGGKTFESLAIISKAILEQTSKSHSKSRFRVLIIANPSIRSKWEWKEKEDLTFEEFTSESYLPTSDIGNFIKQTKIDKPSTQKLFRFFSKQSSVKGKREWIELENKYNQGIWLTSFQSIPRTKGSGSDSEFRQDGRKKLVFPKNFFNWIIVDEAHCLKGSYKDTEESLKWNGTAVSKIYAVLKANKKARLLLLTATPFQNNKSELQQLLNMVERNNERDNTISITNLVASGINELEKQILNLDGGEISIEKLKQFNRNFNDDINALLNFQEDEKIKRPADLKRGNNSKEGLDDFLRDVMIRNTKESLTIKPVIAKLNEAEKFQYLLYRDLIKTTEEESQMFSTKLSQLVSSRDSFTKSNINPTQNVHIEKLFKGNLVFEAKYKKLLETIESIKTSNNKNVITIFVSWLETVDTLESKLKKSKYKVFKLTGQTPTDERNGKLESIRIANEISENKIILIASRVANEGLDFDKFSNRVIHYDNNFNPAIIDQRNGRVYRGSNIATSRKKVIANDIEIYQLFIEESYDQRILFIEQEKRKMKNFYLGDGSLQRVLEKTIEKNNLKQEQEILDIIDKIRIDLTPNRKYILEKYKNEISG